MKQDNTDPKQAHTDTLDLFNSRIRKHLDESLDHLDASAVQRLATARQAALAAARNQPAPTNSRLFYRFQPQNLNWLLPAGAMASIAAMILTLSLLVNTTFPEGADSMLDVELLSSDEHLDVYDNLDFYRWLAANERVG